MQRTVLNSRNLIPLAGVILLLSWNTISVTPGTTGHTSSLAAFNVGIVVGLVIIGLTCFIGKGKLAAKFAAPAAVLGITANVCMYFSSVLPFGESSLVLALGFIVGISQGILYASWFDAYRSFTPKRALCLMLIALAASSVVRVGLTIALDISPALAFLLGSCMLAASAALLHATHACELRRAKCEDEPDVDACFGEPLFAPPPSRFRRVLVELGLCGLVFGVLYADSMHWASGTEGLSLGLIGQALVSLALLWWFTAKLSETHRTTILRVAVIALCLGAVYAAAPTKPSTILLAVSVMSLRTIILVVMYVRLYNAASVSQQNPLLVYCVGRGVFGFAEFLGHVTKVMLDQTFDVSLSTNIALLATICAFMLLLNSLLTRSLITDPYTIAKAQESELSLELRCEKIGNEYGLTPREAEVLVLICSNKTPRNIATDLGISENTVLSHSKQVYRKMDVHSKYDLLLKVLG